MKDWVHVLIRTSTPSARSDKAFVDVLSRSAARIRTGKPAYRRSAFAHIGHLKIEVFAGRRHSMQNWGRFPSPFVLAWFTEPERKFSKQGKDTPHTGRTSWIC